MGSDSSDGSDQSDELWWCCVRRVTVSLSDAGRYKNKKVNSELLTFFDVGMTRFELATTRPPDEYSKPD